MFCLDRQRRQQIEGLEDEADALAPERRALRLAEAADVDVSEPHAAAVGASSPAAQCRNVLLPEPDGPMTAVKLPLRSPSVTRSRATTAPSPRP